MTNSKIEHDTYFNLDLKLTDTVTYLVIEHKFQQLRNFWLQILNYF